jgi:hypothetical protein
VVHATYFLGFDTRQYFEPVKQKLKNLRDPYVAAGNAFSSNLEAVIAVVSMPITLASGTARNAVPTFVNGGTDQTHPSADLVETRFIRPNTRGRK